MHFEGIRNSYRSLKRVIRALGGHDFLQRRQMACETKWLGNVDARWCVCPSTLHGSSVVYSFGVGEDISFDLELIQNFGMQVHAFDPTPRSIEWLRKRDLPQRFVFHGYGVADFDGTCKFHAPANPKHISHTLIERHAKQPSIQVPVYRLTSIMKTLGHDRIDLLKMDIEGAEYGVLEDLLRSRIAVKQFLVEFHHRWPEIGVAKTKQAIRALNDAGFRIFSVSSKGEEYSFLNLAINAP